MRSSFIFIVFAICLSCLPAKGSEPAIDELIEQLASSNETPHWTTQDLRMRPKFAKFDEHDPVRVEAAWDGIIKTGEKAIPVLLKHLGDARYSCTVRSNGYYRNMNVGDVCLDIIIGNIEIYQDHTRFLSEPPCHGRPKFVPRNKTEVQTWWDKHNSSTLRDLQKAGVEFAIATEKNCGNFESSHQKKIILSGLSGLLNVLNHASDPIGGDRHCRILKKQ